MLIYKFIGEYALEWVPVRDALGAPKFNCDFTLEESTVWNLRRVVCYTISLWGPNICDTDIGQNVPS